MDKVEAVAIATLTMLGGFLLGFGVCLMNDAWLYGQVQGTDAKSKIMIFASAASLVGVALLIGAGTIAYRALLLSHRP